jgi:hypothetical protein
MNNRDRCKRCRGPLPGRQSNRFGVYCSTYCYNTHPDNLKALSMLKKQGYGPSWRSEVGQILEQNRELLQRLRQRKQRKRWSWNDYGALQWLRTNGFNFEYHTQIRRRDDGSTEVRCYDEGYVINIKGLLKPIMPEGTVDPESAN